MKLNDEGVTLLSEAILKTAASDYRYCWMLKNRNAGDCVFVWAKHKKKKGDKCRYILCRGSLYGLKGTVDHNIQEIERYIEYHPLVGHFSKEIINGLRAEALEDRKVAGRD